MIHFTSQQLCTLKHSHLHFVLLLTIFTPCPLDIDTLPHRNIFVFHTLTKVFRILNTSNKWPLDLHCLILVAWELDLEADNTHNSRATIQVALKKLGTVLFPHNWSSLPGIVIMISDVPSRILHSLYPLFHPKSTHLPGTQPPPSLSPPTISQLSSPPNSYDYRIQTCE